MNDMTVSADLAALRDAVRDVCAHQEMLAKASRDYGIKEPEEG